MALKTAPREGVLIRNSAGQAISFFWEPAKIGPAFEWLDHDRIRILEGGLAGREFGVKTELLHYAAAIALYHGHNQIGTVSIERDPPGKGIILWDAGVKEEFRRNGLTAIMTWIVFRELLETQETAFFRIRMVRSLKSGDKGVELQNVGMGVIAARLGFTPEINLERIINGDNITDIDIIPANNGMPPALKISLKRDPFFIVAFVLNPDTMKPTNEFRVYLEIKHDDWLIHEWARRGILVINGNYVLREPQVNHFVNRIAVDEAEAIIFRRKIRGL